MRLLIVEDEAALAGGLKFNFEQEGYEVEVVGDGPSALQRLAQGGIDLVILDLMLPGMSGYDICEELRRTDPDLPVLVLSARTLSFDKTQAFDCGADQYLTKPFELAELLSRVRSLLKRRRRTRTMAVPAAQEPQASFQLGAAHINLETFQVMRDGQTSVLTTLEAQLLRYFLQNPGRVLSRVEILEEVWGERSDISTRSIDNFVLRLRKLIEPDPARPVHLLSVRGTGYRLVRNPNP